METRELSITFSIRNVIRFIIMKTLQTSKTFFLPKNFLYFSIIYS